MIIILWLKGCIGVHVAEIPEQKESGFKTVAHSPSLEGCGRQVERNLKMKLHYQLSDVNLEFLNLVKIAEFLLARNGR